MTKTKPELIKKHVYKECIFKDTTELEEYLRTHGSGKTDLIAVDGILYTMDEFDHDGRYIQWLNRRTTNMIECHTHNRYRGGFEDATVEFYPKYGAWRDDINYRD